MQAALAEYLEQVEEMAIRLGVSEDGLQRLNRFVAARYLDRFIVVFSSREDGE